MLTAMQIGRGFGVSYQEDSVHIMRVTCPISKVISVVRIAVGNALVTMRMSVIVPGMIMSMLLSAYL